MQEIIIFAGDFFGRGDYANSTFRLTEKTRRGAAQLLTLRDVSELEIVVQRPYRTLFTLIFIDGRSFLGEANNNVWHDIQLRFEADLIARSISVRDNMASRICSGSLLHRLWTRFVPRSTLH